MAFCVLVGMVNSVDTPTKASLMALENPFKVVEDANVCKGAVIWDAMCPHGISFSEHKLTILDAVEQALLFMGTDYADEWIVASPEVMAILRTLPCFVEQSPLRFDTGLLLGKLGRKNVYVNFYIHHDTWHVGHRGLHVKCAINNLCVKSFIRG